MPVLIAGEGVRGGVNIGVRASFADLAATIGDALEVKGPRDGVSFWEEIEK